MVSVPSVPVTMMTNPPGAGALPPWMLSESSAPLPSRPCSAIWPGTWLAISSPVSTTETRSCRFARTAAQLCGLAPTIPTRIRSDI